MTTGALLPSGPDVHRPSDQCTARAADGAQRQHLLLVCIQFQNVLEEP